MDHKCSKQKENSAPGSTKACGGKPKERGKGKPVAHEHDDDGDFLVLGLGVLRDKAIVA